MLSLREDIPAEAFMKIISIWQPWASLIVHGFKTIETRSWNAPKSVIGQRIGIAATKNILPEQLAAFNDPDFQKFYCDTGLPALDQLPRGAVLGSAVLHSSSPIDQETVDDITDEEFAFGWFTEGRYAWRLRGQQAFGPYAARGAQGLWEWEPPHEVVTQIQDNHRAGEEGTPHIRRILDAGQWR